MVVIHTVKKGEKEKNVLNTSGPSWSPPRDWVKKEKIKMFKVFQSPLVPASPHFPHFTTYSNGRIRPCIQSEVQV